MLDICCSGVTNPSPSAPASHHKRDSVAKGEGEGGRRNFTPWVVNKTSTTYQTGEGAVANNWIPTNRRAIKGGGFRKKVRPWFCLHAKRTSPLVFLCKIFGYVVLRGLPKQRVINSYLKAGTRAGSCGCEGICQFARPRRRQNMEYFADKRNESRQGDLIS